MPWLAFGVDDGLKTIFSEAEKFFSGLLVEVAMLLSGPKGKKLFSL